VDYVVGHTYYGEKEYLLLRCGRRIYVKRELTPPKQTVMVAKEYAASLPDTNKLSLDSLRVTGDATYITLNTNSATLTSSENGQSIRLSDKEFRILEYMIANKGNILTREQLALKIWGYDNEAEYNNVEVYMSFTRKKLAFIHARTQIKAVRGIGYELRCEDV
jgi:DNA-binding response OmpR family regulator